MNDKRQQSATAVAREAALTAAALATPGRPRPSPVPMTSTPSLSGPEAGDNVECNGAARRRRQLHCAIPAQVVSELLLAVYMTSRAGPDRQTPQHRQAARQTDSKAKGS